MDPSRPHQAGGRSGTLGRTSAEETRFRIYFNIIHQNYSLQEVVYKHLYDQTYNNL
jgi:hypothetical protein